MYKVTSLQPIVDCFEAQAIWGVTELSIFLKKDRSLIQKYLKALLRSKKIITIGSGPHIRYSKAIDSKQQLSTTISSSKPINLMYNDILLLEDHFLKFAPDGEMLIGQQGFVRRCYENKLHIFDSLTKFTKIIKNIEKQKNTCGLINVTKDFHKQVKGGSIDKLFYVDHYKRPGFGRSKLAELTFYAKDSQSPKLINQSILSVKNQLECFIKNSDIEAIAFIPHSRKRSIQLLSELRRKLHIQGLPVIELMKYAPYKTIIAQKNLKTREQRIQNAQQTILLQDSDEAARYKKVLLIDDFVGSGATLNETAKKLKNIGIEQIIGFAFVGNTNLSYEVINEM